MAIGASTLDDSGSGSCIRIAKRHTADFVAAHLPAGASLIEVGCGNGEVAAELARRGYAVTAIDADANCVAQARLLGVAAIAGEWPLYDEPGFATMDAVAFTRSLHHVHHLREAVARAAELTRPGGRILLEEFAHDDADPRSLEWFAGVLRRAVAASLLAPPADSLTRALIESSDLPAAWRRHHTHDHPLHTIAAMRDALLAAHCRIGYEAPAPWLYRYLLPLLPATPAGMEFAENVFRDEAARSANGEFALVGRRIVAVR